MRKSGCSSHVRSGYPCYTARMRSTGRFVLWMLWFFVAGPLFVYGAYTGGLVFVGDSPWLVIIVVSAIIAYFIVIKCLADWHERGNKNRT